ncbi:MAG: leucine-rich repeat protein [Lachnospiraceae bacterium]|nr:leucine-rich repeat protein [Lachnospiraceae bacterium]
MKQIGKKVFLAALMVIAVICFVPRLSIIANAANYTEVVIETKDNTFGKFKGGRYFIGDPVPKLQDSDFIVKSAKTGSAEADTTNVSIDYAGSWWYKTGSYAHYTKDVLDGSSYVYKLRIKIADGTVSEAFKAIIDGVTFRKIETFDSSQHIYTLQCDEISLNNLYKGKLNDDGTVRYLYDNNTKTMTIFGSGDMTDFSSPGNEIQSKNAAETKTYQDKTTKIIIEDGVTSIGGFTFYGFKALEEIDISDDVTYIGSNAFNPNIDYAESLKNLKLPSKLKKIGTGCFRNNLGFTELIIPDSVESIGDYSFCNCRGLTKVKLSSKIKEIPKAAFEDCAFLEKIDIPSGVELVGEEAFDSCWELSEVNLPDTLKTIGKNSFRKCFKLNWITIPDSVTTIFGMDEDPTYSVFTNYSKVEIFANPGTAGAEYALQKDNLLLNISPATVSGLKTMTYTGKELKQSFTVSFGTKELKEGTDYEVKFSKNINAGTAIIDISGIGKFSGVRTATFKIDAIDISNAEVTGIEDKDFTGSPITQIPVVKLGEKTLIEGIDYNVTYKDNTNAGTAIVIINGIGNYKGTISKTFTIKDYPEKKGKELTDIEIAGKFVVISNDLKNLTVEYTGTTDPTAKTVTIPDTIKVGNFTYKVTSIADKALKGNKKMTTLIIGANVKVIGNSAFAGCTKLKKVDCKSKVLEKIGKSAFSGDKKLKSIILKTKLLKKSKVGKNAIKNTSKKLVIKVPKKSVKSYKKIFKAKGNKKVVVKK